MSISAISARALSPRQQRFMIRHIDGPVQVTICNSLTRMALVGKGLLRCDRSDHPRTTMLTPDGRFAVAVLLGDAADALVAAGLLDADVAARVATKVSARKSAARNSAETSPPPE